MILNYKNYFMLLIYKMEFTDNKEVFDQYKNLRKKLMKLVKTTENLKLEGDEFEKEAEEFKAKTGYDVDVCELKFKKAKN